ncbi:disease resistance protein RPM1-like isoform X2 [Hevea brasiliensis]|uniref:disease resistance protein RPM1-like isoform X2 n=1 Tax=Hevea brasiliensis TaxID=3981 RepID=UPI0025D0FA5F|nr:disease resistance protein RPM1-like isoform X2 [Hevea brasiliensis]
MASAAVDHVIGLIVSTVQNEATLSVGINDELDEIKRELVSMKSFLHDAERKRVMSEVMKTWVADVRDIADQIEDLIDEYMYYVYRQQHFTKLHRIFRTPKTRLETRQIASKLQQINKTIKGMDERRQRYGIDRIEGTNDHYNFPLYQRDLALFMKEDDVVGFVDESRLLKTWLMDKEEHRTLISTVGMGGSGKTTLVAKTYNDETVKSYFECCAWITVSQTYTRDDLLRSLIKEFHQSRKEEVPNDLGTKDFKDLVGILIGYLEQKKYLVVLDDVWDTNLWEAIKVSLPNNQFGSRIMLTTRKEDVGSYSSDVRSHILTIKPLKEKEAWDLFCMKAFSSCPGNSCPKELEPWALELVRKCKGLPLAVVALGGLLSSKKSITEWSSVCDNLNWQLNNNQMLEVVKSILLLSFSDLPSPLKHCFLYCCLFPEDYEIRRKRLIKLWIAEGFVQQVDRTAPKEVAESYLMELILRSMLQVVRRNEFGRPKRCKMHDLLREIGLSISEKEKFGVVYDGKVEIGECESHQARRLSIQTTKGDLQSYSSITRLRSLFVFVNGSVSFSNTLLSKFKLLRTLDLENAAIDVLPEELGTLFNLRYLNLRGTPMAELPKSIGELRNLELLDISETNIKELPSEVAKLQNLRHLNMWSKFIADIHNFELVRGMQVPFEISKLKKLQVMANIEAEGNIIKQLRSMTQVSRMGISNLKEADEQNMCSSIQNLKLLHHLCLMVNNETEFLRVDALRTPPPQLQKLFLFGKLENVPHWFCSLQNLTYLWLHWSRLKDDPLPHIAALPNLRKKGVMPDIQELWIDSCLMLNAVPYGIESLTNLQSLLLTNCSASLIGRVNDVESKDRSKVLHIPNIKCFKRRAKLSYRFSPEVKKE